MRNLKLVRSLDAMMETAFSNCFPGANYQRLTTSLQILDRFSSIFFDAFDRSCGVNKASGDGDPGALVRSCNEAHGLLVWQNRHVTYTELHSLLI